MQSATTRKPQNFPRTSGKKSTAKVTVSAVISIHQKQRATFDTIVLTDGNGIISLKVLAALFEARVFKIGRLLYVCGNKGAKISAEAYEKLQQKNIFPPQEFVVS